MRLLDRALVLVGLILALLAAVAGSRRFLLAPIARLESAVARWRQGDLGARARTAETGTELARLDATFDDVAQRLAAREAERAQALESLRASEARFRAIIEDQSEFISRFTPDLTLTFVNRAYAAQLGRDAEALIGTSLLDLMTKEQRAQFVAQLDALTPESPTVSYDMEAPLPDGTSGWERWTDRALFDARGQVVEYQSVGRDITASRRAEAALRESEERLRLAVEATGLGTWDVDVTAGTRRWSPEFLAILGLPPGTAADPGLFASLIHPDDRDWVNERYRRAYRDVDAGPYDAEFRIRPADGGGERWVRTVGRIFFDASGRPLRGIGTLMDVSERKRDEERQRLLLAELSHRVKNTLATVQAIASRSLSGERTLEEGRHALTKRLRALAKTHDLLTASRWRGAGLRAVLEGELKPYGKRARIAGPEVELTPKAAQTMGLVLHELATNAAKHGALSLPEGWLEVGWSFAPTDADGHHLLRLTWRERGGPPVTPPRWCGFGRTLIEQGLKHDLGGQVVLDFAAAGLVCELAVPITAANVVEG
jgi:PAS domain S-box-containing protein